ncbi:hypothetical protein MPSEU_000278600 [Mayamaea pseudoterrestris]|nr:hypothetical protein MPSEU_000278600 [Mayamaea pseudoterrestris]
MHQHKFFLVKPSNTIHSLLLISTIILVIMASSTVAMTAAAASGFYKRLPLQIKLLSQRATLPKAGSDLAAGLDLCSAIDIVIPAQQRALVPTDLSVACPAGTYARIAPRSGLALKHGIDVGAGVIDADYRGPVGVILFNWGKEDFVIKHGDRIAQMILEQIVLPEIVQVDDLSDTVRGDGGFGSTGVSSEPMPKRLRTEAEEGGGKRRREEGNGLDLEQVRVRESFARA